MPKIAYHSIGNDLSRRLPNRGKLSVKSLIFSNLLDNDGDRKKALCDHAIALCLALGQDGRIYQMIIVRNNS
ncbi:hypothetical protein [Nostoc sp. LEGE 12450]|uniref:hypothetical protein n=1 Tax=Nostoc sp. LEGE 12450 TaxID=1828643 RepID=UPI001881BC88|nr:hypothetical protein [Nostoc sp. LEGE 12450]MBE8990038.1 hypothetical protein [Nostoc sp. LEGE 12450]